MPIFRGTLDTWKTSSYTNGGGACVEVKTPDTASLAVRDTKWRTGPMVVFTAEAWNDFVASVKE